jgi:hypothetical protein
MTIIEKLPDYFINTLSETTDQDLLKRFSGKTLLKIAGLGTLAQRESHIRSIVSRNPASQSRFAELGS